LLRAVLFAFVFQSNILFHRRAKILDFQWIRGEIEVLFDPFSLPGTYSTQILLRKIKCRDWLSRKRIGSHLQKKGKQIIIILSIAKRSHKTIEE
jgi:hypothetical protein